METSLHLAGDLFALERSLEYDVKTVEESACLLPIA